VPTASPELKAVVLDTTTTFDLVSSNYTARSTFAGVNVDVGLEVPPAPPDYGLAPPGGGAWSIESDLVPGQFAAAGTGDVTGVVPSQGDFYVGRAYTLTWTPVADHTTPADSAITTSGTYQGNYIDQGADACAGYTADYSASSGWGTTVDTANAAAEDLTFDFYAKPSGANPHALFAVSESTPLDSFENAAILIRFNDNNPGTIDVRNGPGYCSAPGETACATDVEYVVGEWYHFVVNASISQQSYTVDVETCDDGLVTVMTDAAFRTGGAATPPETLQYHNAWSANADAIQINLATEGAWTPGVCTPGTCGGVPATCGAPPDGCGGSLSCGTCSEPNPVCDNAYNCCDPEPLATTCGAAVCGSAINNCDETVDCGSCSGTDVCTQGQCVAGGIPGAPYVHVTPADVGVTVGVGVVAPVPTQSYAGPSTLSASNLATAVTNGHASGSGTVGDPWLIENVIINGTLYPETDNIVLRNVDIRTGAGDFYSIYYRCGAPGESCSNIVVEYSTISGCEQPCKVFRGAFDEISGGLRKYQNLIWRNNDVQGGHDFWHFDGDLDGWIVENNYVHDSNAGGSRHVDGFQLGEYPEYGVTQGAITVRGNWFTHNTTKDDYNLDPADKGGLNAILFMTGSQANNNTNVIFENNFVGDWGQDQIALWAANRCSDADSCIFRYNVYDDIWQTQLPAAGAPSHIVWYDDGCSNGNCNAPSEVRCERYQDGTFVQDAYIRDGTNITTGCPAYPPLAGGIPATFPTLATTGITDEMCPDWDAKKTTYSGPFTLTGGEVVEYAEYTGSSTLLIDSDSSDVVLRCVKFQNNNGAQTLAVHSINDSTTPGSNSTTDILIEDSFFDQPYSGNDQDVLSFFGSEAILARSTVIGGCADALKFGGGMLVDSYLEAGYTNPGICCTNPGCDPYDGGSDPHWDVSQAFPCGRGDWWVKHNSLLAPTNLPTSVLINSTTNPAGCNSAFGFAQHYDSNFMSGGAYTIYAESPDIDDLRFTNNLMALDTWQWGPFEVSTDPNCLEMKVGGVFSNQWDQPDTDGTPANNLIIDGQYNPATNFANAENVGEATNAASCTTSKLKPFPTWTVSSPALSSTSCTAGVDCGVVGVSASASGNGTATGPPYTGSSPRWRYRCGQSATQMWNKADGVAAGTLEDTAETSTINCNGLSTCNVTDACDFTSTPAGTYTVKIYSEAGPGAGIRVSDMQELTFTVN
jgi:hypothetical protein